MFQVTPLPSESSRDSHEKNKPYFLRNIKVKMQFLFGALRVKAPKTKIVEFANSVYPDGATQQEPSHLGLYCLSSSL